MPWLSLKVKIDARSAEDFSDALLAAGAQSASIDLPESDLPIVSALLPEDADARAMVARAASLCELSGPPAFELAGLADEDWVRRTQAQFAPLRTARLWIGPTWLEPPANVEALVRLDPGLAFGTGSHASTRLVLAYLERELKRGDSVLDYGCGSGVLAIAASKLGAGHVDAVDVDPQAVEVTRDNAARNAVRVHAALADELGPRVYDLVVANILPQPLVVLAPLLAARTISAGHIALSGILAAQADDVIYAYRPWFAMHVHAEEDGWVLVAGRRTWA
jgi:ribosomal protein L11 methyltransferase